MKTTFTKWLLVLTFVAAIPTAQAADPTSTSSPNNRHHNGFFFSFGLGPAFGHIDEKFTYTGASMDSTGEFRGTPFAVDMRFGGAVIPDLLVTFDIVSRSMSSPEVKKNNETYVTNKNLTLSETTYGVGITKYFMPLNIYAGATLGTGVFVLNYSDGSLQNSTAIRSNFGFSWLVRAGKSWYLGRRWGLGVGLAYGNTTTHTTDTDGKEELSSDQFMGTIAVTYQ